jgi:signal transduction histidine kinase
MKGQIIRTRMAQAAVLPVLLVVLTIVGIFWNGRVQDLETSHRQRVELLAHQVALYSGYDLFSGNTANLQGVVQAVQSEPGVLAVQVFDTTGRPIASSPYNLDSGSASSAPSGMGPVDVHMEPIYAALVPIDDLFSLESAPPKREPALLGTARIVVSRQNLEDRKREALLTALTVGAIGIMLGALLAMRLGNRVVQPMLRISQVIRRIGQGDFTVDEQVPDDPLQELQTALNQMAKRLAWGREELERQVATVTHELRQQKEQAESATLAKSRFLGAASHDLRQPSHALGMFVARLSQLPMEPAMRQLVEKLDLSVQTLQDLLDGLLDLSRLDSGSVQPRMGPVDLNQMLASVRHSLQGMAESKGLRLRLRPTRLWAHSDALLLQRMLVNLVINAIRYTERGTVLVCCRLHPSGQGLRVEVWDSGIGIPAQHHEDVFQEFYQLANRAGDRNFGLGLGLNIVQRSAALLGHGIALRSQPGCGTRFSILLGAATPSDSAPGLLAHPTERFPGNLRDITGMRVLLIEDNANARAAVQMLLQSWGCEVQDAADLAGALAHVQNAVPDVILSDYHLGASETGVACIAAVRAQCGTSIPACLMSGDTHEAFLQEVKTAQLPLLHKPVRPAKLRSLLRHMLP